VRLGGYREKSAGRVSVMGRNALDALGQLNPIETDLLSQRADSRGCTPLRRSLDRQRLCRFRKEASAAQSGDRNDKGGDRP
jgi:hypothetical protein